MEHNHVSGVQLPESVTKLYKTASKSSGSAVLDPVEMAKEQFQIAAKAGCELGFKWLQRLEEEEKRLLTEWHINHMPLQIFSLFSECQEKRNKEKVWAQDQLKSEVTISDQNSTMFKIALPCIENNC